MKKRKIFSIKYVIWLFAALILLPVLVFAINAWNEGYRVDHGNNTVEVYVGNSDGTKSTGVCYKVTNKHDVNDYFIPTKTAKEWEAFSNNLPDGVTIGPCCTTENGGWSDWSDCSVTCGKGTRTRTCSACNGSSCLDYSSGRPMAYRPGKTQTVSCTGSGQDCPCIPESDATFCWRLGKECGSVTGTDNCGKARTVGNCGQCASTQVCYENSCVNKGHWVYCGSKENCLGVTSVGGSCMSGADCPAAGSVCFPVTHCLSVLIPSQELITIPSYVCCYK